MDNRETQAIEKIEGTIERHKKHWTQYTKWLQTKQKTCTQHIKLKIWATQISQKNEVNAGAHQDEGQAVLDS
jgi:hypothetical protein